MDIESLFFMLPILIIPVGLILYAIMGFAKNIGGSEPKNMSLYRLIFFYTVLVIVIIVATVVSDMRTSVIDSIAVPLLFISYVLSLISFFRNKKFALPFFVDLFFGMAILQLTFYLGTEIFIRFGGISPVILGTLVQILVCIVVAVRIQRR